MIRIHSLFFLLRRESFMKSLNVLLLLYTNAISNLRIDIPYGYRPVFQKTVHGLNLISHSHEFQTTEARKKKPLCNVRQTVFFRRNPCRGQDRDLRPRKYYNSEARNQARQHDERRKSLMNS